MREGIATHADETILAWIRAQAFPKGAISATPRLGSSADENHSARGDLAYRATLP